MSKDLSSLLDEEPPQWGFRGDEILWGVLREHFSGIPVPNSLSELVEILEKSFEYETGARLGLLHELSNEKFCAGGMSSGMISGDFWREKGFPLIIKRYLSLPMPLITQPREPGLNIVYKGQGF